MKFDDIMKLLSGHKKKAILGAGLIPVAFLAWKKRKAIWSGMKGVHAGCPVDVTPEMNLRIDEFYETDDMEE